MQKSFATAALLGALLIFGAADANIVGEIDFDGQTLYVWRLFGSVIVEDGAITLSGDSRIYLLVNPSILIRPEDYYQVVSHALNSLS